MAHDSEHHLFFRHQSSFKAWWGWMVLDVFLWPFVMFYGAWSAYALVCHLYPHNLLGESHLICLPCIAMYCHCGLPRIPGHQASHSKQRSRKLEPKLWSWSKDFRGLLQRAKPAMVAGQPMATDGNRCGYPICVGRPDTPWVFWMRQKTTPPTDLGFGK